MVPDVAYTGSKVLVMLKRLLFMLWRIVFTLVLCLLTVWGLGIVLGLAHSRLLVTIGDDPTRHGLLGINTHQIIAVLRVPLQMLNLIIGVNVGYRWGWRNKMFIIK